MNKTSIEWPAIYSEILRISRKRAEAASQNNDSVQEADA
jgi:hypothetical protein